MDIDDAVAAARVADRIKVRERVREQLIAHGSARAWAAANSGSARGSTPTSDAVRAVGWEEAAYPSGLRSLSTPPPALFVRGLADPLPPVERCVALVGARRCTEEGRWVARDLARGLARAGWVVVSGLALGIDVAAHTGALDGGGRTLAVLPSDVDHPTPRRNHAVAEQIAAGGGWLVSERPPGALVRPESFPRRNRLVAALAGAVVVVEAAGRSGTLSTVEWALKLGRRVGAVPGSVLSPASAGANALIAAGAGVVTSTADVEALFGRGAPSPPAAAVDDDSLAVLDAIPGAGGPLDQWVRRSGIPADRARSALLRLLASGSLRRVGGGRIARSL